MSSEPPEATFAFPQLSGPAALAGGPDQLRMRAWATGQADGRKAGLEAARADVMAALGVLSGALDEMRAANDELAGDLERAAAELAVRLSEQILCGALAVEPERVIDITRGALRRVADRRNVTIVVNPDDLELVGASVQTLRAELGGLEHCDVQSDRRVARGGAVVRTDAGEIDAGIDTQLERAREVIAAALRERADA